MNKLASLILASALLISSCGKDNEDPDDTKIYNLDISLILSEMVDGQLSRAFLYNANRTIREIYGPEFYTFYSYKKEFLETITTYMNEPEVIPEKSYKAMAMVPPGSVFDTTGADLMFVTRFIYDSSGRIVNKTTELTRNGIKSQFRNVSITYNSNELIGETTVADSSGVNRTHTFDYDSDSNIEKEYIYIIETGETPQLEREIDYTYDDMKNPFRVFRNEAEPGSFTNKNNIVSIRTTWHINPPPSGNVIEESFVITYNQAGYPVNVNNNIVYQYEAK